MTKEVFLVLLTEEGLSRWEAEGIWTAQVKAYPEQRCPPHGRQCPGARPRDVAAMKRLRDLQRARGATHRPDL